MELKENEISLRQTMLGEDTEKYIETYLGSATNEIMNQVRTRIHELLPAQCTLQQGTIASCD